MTALLLSGLVLVTGSTRPLPPWPYSPEVFPAAWFGSNSTNMENDTQLEALGKYSLAVFGFFHLLTRDNYTHEGAALIDQARIVKRRHPKLPVGIYLDNLRFEPFYDAMHTAIVDPPDPDFFLLNASSPSRAPLLSTTYCVQMIPRVPARDPRCLARFWNWFNPGAVRYFLDKVVEPLVAQEGFDFVFFDGADGFIRGARFPGAWEHASNVPPNTTHEDAVQTLVNLHGEMAELLYRHGKYTVLSEHLQDTGNTTTTDEGAIVSGLLGKPYMRYYEDFLRGPTHLGDSQLGYVETIVSETQKDSVNLPEVIHYVAEGNRLEGTPAVAAFLIGRGEYSYFMASTGWYDNDFQWHAEYDVDYGRPLGSAQRSGSTFTREYSKCSVSLNCTDPHACVGSIRMKQ